MNPWLVTESGPLYRVKCECGNPVITTGAQAATCDQHGAPVCAIAGCLRHRLVGSRGSTYALCGHHAKRRYRYGDPFHETRATAPTYRTVHGRTQRAKGPASAHACIDCGETARDWSYVGGAPDEQVDSVTGLAYSDRPEFYVPRCRGCHVEHDGRRRDEKGQWAGKEER